MSFLEDVLADVSADLKARMDQVPLDQLKAQAEKQAPALDPMPAFRADGVSVIAEVKRCSPTKGALASIPDPAQLAMDYVAGGAAAISVLTEQHHFGGTLEDLRAVRGRVDIPVLRKDFITTAYQLWEARAAGADLALLIVAALDQSALESLIERSRSIGLTPLVEVHDQEETRRALDAGADLVGVNARNLKTFKVDPTTFQRVAPLIPDGVVRVAASGVQGPRDVIDYAKAGANVVLVGETLVKGDDPRSTVADLVAAGTHPAVLHRWP